MVDFAYSPHHSPTSFLLPTHPELLAVYQTVCWFMAQCLCTCYFFCHSALPHIPHPPGKYLLVLQQMIKGSSPLQNLAWYPYAELITLLFFLITVLSLYFIITFVLPVSSWAEIREILGTKESGRISESRENGNEALTISCAYRGLSSSDGNEDEKGSRVKISFENTVDRIFWLTVVGEKKGRNLVWPLGFWLKHLGIIDSVAIIFLV